jgi:hypothetical protein
MIAALTALLLSAAVGAQPADGAPSLAPPPKRLYVLGKLGLSQPVGAQVLVNLSDERGPRWDLDLLVEPSRQWQSLSVGGAFRPFHNALHLGARARWMQLHPPWSRGYVFALDNALAVGPELGGRWGMLSDDRLMLGLGVGAVFSPWGRAALPTTYTLDLSVGWKVKEH